MDKNHPPINPKLCIFFEDVTVVWQKISARGQKITLR
jgi:hypothetical protein|nr:MAG TPA: hypothetical protein [Caudoviricetes sp.]